MIAQTVVEARTFEADSYTQDQQIFTEDSSVSALSLAEEDYELTIDAGSVEDGFTPEVLSDDYDEGGTDVHFTLPTPVRDGYTFAGWAVSSDAVLVDGDNIDLSSCQSDVTITASWILDEYNIVWNLDGGNFEGQIMLPERYSVEDMPMVITLTDPVRDGYTFKGWATDDINAVIDGNTVDLTKCREDVTITATWEEDTYKITYDLDGGYFQTYSPVEAALAAATTTLDSTDVKLNDNAPADTSQDNNTQDAFQINENNPDEIILKDDAFTVSSDAITIANPDTDPNTSPDDNDPKAEEEILLYELVEDDGTVSYGSLSESYTVTDESLKLLLPVPVRDGYEFEGWQANNPQAIIDGNHLDLTKCHADLTLKAIWKTTDEITLEDEKVTLYTGQSQPAIAAIEDSQSDSVQIQEDVSIQADPTIAAEPYIQGEVIIQDQAPLMDDESDILIY